MYKLEEITINCHRLAVAGLSATLLTMLSACSGEQMETTPIVRPVQYVQVAPGSGIDRMTYSGTTKSHIDTRISFKVGGTVVARPVSVGDKVEPGQMLARLDAQDFNVAVQDTRAGVAAAQAELRNAEANFDRVTGLYENRNASKAQLDAVRAGAESAKAQLRSASERLHGAQLQLSYTEIESPESCTVAETYVKTNENIAAGQAIVRLNCGKCAEVKAYLPETHIGLVRSAMPVQVTVDAFPDDSFSAVVSQVGVATGTGTFSVTAILGGDCPAMRSGMAADLHFAFRKPQDEGRIAVPPVSVGEDRVGNYVFVLERQGDEWIARRRSVSVGEITDRGEFFITDGLTTGEYIATAGVRRIQDGLQVRLLENSQLFARGND